MTLFAPYSVDVVAVYSSDGFVPLFSSVQPMKAEVRETSRVMRHPVETGVMLADHHVINPIEIDLQVFIASSSYSTAYYQLKAAFIAATKLTVQTKTGVYPNMIIAMMPHEESPEFYDMIAMSLRLTEVIYMVPSSSPGSASQSDYSAENPADSDTVNRGQQVCTFENPQGTGLTSAAPAGGW